MRMRGPMVQISAVCVNDKCQDVVLLPCGLGGAPGATFGPPTFSPMPRCPRCGSATKIPEAKYVVTETGMMVTPLSSADRDMLRRAHSLLSAAIIGQMTPEQFQEEAAKQVPELAKVWKDFATSPDGFFKMAGTILAIIAILVALSKKEPAKAGKENPLAVPEQTQKIIDAIHSLKPQRDTRLDTRNEIRKERRERSRQLERWKRGRK